MRRAGTQPGAGIETAFGLDSTLSCCTFQIRAHGLDKFGMQHLDYRLQRVPVQNELDVHISRPLTGADRAVSGIGNRNQTTLQD